MDNHSKVFLANGVVETIDNLKNNFILGDRLHALQKIPDNSIAMVFTSPPYNLEKEYLNHHDDMELNEYYTFLEDTWKECYRVLKDGGRMVVNVPFSITKFFKDGKHTIKKLIPLNSIVMQQLERCGFTYRNEMVWDKDNVTSRTAWGSWKSPSSPYIVGPYEMILVFHKDNKVLEGKKENIDITGDEFIKFSFGMWKIMPETGKHKNHPAPFPKELVYRLLKFYTYKDDVVVDPFSGTGTVAEVCLNVGRKFIYIDNTKEYLEYAQENIFKEKVIKDKKISKQQYEALEKNILTKINEKNYDKTKIKEILENLLAKM